MPLSADSLVADWSTLLAAALIGTRQAAGSAELPVPASVEGGEVLPRQALHAAAALGLLRRAGYVPPAAPDLPAPAAPETRPEIGAGGVAAVRRIVEEKVYVEHLMPYLRQVVAAGRRLPHGPELLAVLDMLTQDARPGDATWARPALGERGEWLAAFHPAWERALGATPAAETESDDLVTWETGLWPERLAWLTARFEADPAAARALLLAALPVEPARQQEPLLELLESYLTAEAEPVLESLLKARGQDVRRRAAELLVRLPGAALADRLWARAEPLVKRKTALLGKDALEVELPTTWNKSWLFDGIEERNDHYRWRFNLSTGHGHNATIGEAAVRLGTLLALVPVRRWLTHFGVDAPELLGLGLRSTDWQQALLVGWSMSAVNTRDFEVIEAFIELYFTRHEYIKRVASGVRWYELTSMLPPDRRVAIVGPPLLSRVRQNSPDWPEQVGLMPAPWPRELTVAVLGALVAKAADPATGQQTPAELSRFRYQTIRGLTENIAAEDLPWAIGALAPERLPPMPEPFRQGLEAAREELAFRQALADSLL